MCGCTSDAFALALRHNKLRQYAEVLENSDAAQPSNYLDVAQHFEREKYTLLAGKYYFFAKDYARVWPSPDDSRLSSEYLLTFPFSFLLFTFEGSETFAESIFIQQRRKHCAVAGHRLCCIIE